MRFLGPGPQKQTKRKASEPLYRRETGDEATDADLTAANMRQARSAFAAKAPHSPNAPCFRAARALRSSAMRRAAQWVVGLALGLGASGCREKAVPSLPAPSASS